jgi:hypothetical protein
MHEAAAATAPETTPACERLSGAVDTLSSTIAGFALLAGARAFMFIALLGWREPVLSGAGLVLLALVGWLRWRWGGVTVLPATRRGPPAIIQRNTACAGRHPFPTEGRNIACYNRSTECASKRGTTPVERQWLWPCADMGGMRPCGDRVTLPGPSVPTRAACRQPDHKETTC